MPKTNDDLAKRALAILGKIEARQTPNPEDVDAVKAVIPALVMQLGIENVTYVGGESEIDDAVFLPLAKRLALEMAPEFGLPAPDEAAILDANMPLRRLSASRPTGATVRVEYF